MEIIPDVLGESISVGLLHDAQQAGAINLEQDPSGIRVGLHDEIFRSSTPVLAGVDAQLTYCCLLTGEWHRDGDTWDVHLLDASG